MDTTGCDIDLPGDECSDTGGAIHLTAQLPAVHVEYSIIAMFMRRDEDFYSPHRPSDGPVIMAYWKVVRGSVSACNQESKLDLTDLATCMVGVISKAGMPRPRGLLIASSELWGFACIDGGVWKLSFYFEEAGPGENQYEEEAFVLVLLPPARAQ